MSWRRRLGTRLDRSQEVAHLLYSSAALQQVTGKDILQILRGSVDAICFAAAVGVGLRCAFAAQYHGLQDRAAESPRRFHHQDLGVVRDFLLIFFGPKIPSTLIILNLGFGIGGL